MPLQELSPSHRFLSRVWHDCAIEVTSQERPIVVVGENGNYVKKVESLGI
jgi:hypothetical protein